MITVVVVYICSVGCKVMSELVESGACYMMLVKAGERLAWKDRSNEKPIKFLNC